MMKLAFYIFAFYTVVLSCIPCQDELQLPVYEQSIVSADAGPDRPNSIDLCSPFCICACCAGITLQHSIACLPDLQSYSFSEEKSFAYISHADSGNSIRIWQPPKDLV